MAQVPITTIPPFADIQRLPDCAKKCGPLYDVNGGCVPPAAPTRAPHEYTACFCSHSQLTAFSKGPTGVCDDACNGNNAQLQSIANWYKGMCASQGDELGFEQNSPPTSTASPQGTPRQPSSGGGGNWLSNHWQWVVMIVVLVVGIAAIWIGACVWRRRYLRKRDRRAPFGQKHLGGAADPSWVAPIPGSESTMPINHSQEDPERSLAEKPPKEKKKWTVNRRT